MVSIARSVFALNARAAGSTFNASSHDAEPELTVNPRPTMDLSATLQRILTEPTPADLWSLQGDLLAAETHRELATQARRVAGDFYLYLSDLQSKVTSRQHSQWAAALATASVTSVSFHDLLHGQVDAFKQLLSSGTPALLEIGSALQSVKAWEVDTGLVHHDAALKLYGELWDLSTTMFPNLSAAERRAYLDQLVGAAVSPDTPGQVKALLLVKLYQWVLALRLVPLLNAAA
jgi:hypothetical protein